MCNTYYLINNEGDFDIQINQMSSSTPYFQINRDQVINVENSCVYVYNYTALGKSLKDYYEILCKIMSHNNTVRILVDGTEYTQNNWEEERNWMLKALRLDSILRVEATNQGLTKAKKDGVKLGRRSGSKNKVSLQVSFNKVVHEMREKGFTLKQISDTLHISVGTIVHILKK